MTPYVGPTEDVDEQFPIILTTGRVVSQFLSGNQTRRIGPLVDHYPEPRIEMHPRLAARLGIAEGDWTLAETRRGNCTLARLGRDDDPAGYRLHPVSLGGAQERESAHHFSPGSDFEDS